MAIFLGVDGGGSKTTCLVADELRVLGRGAAGGSNLVRCGEVAARTALQAAILQACAEAKIAPSQIVQTVIGAAGAGRTDGSEAMRRLLREIVAGDIAVVGDMEIALHAAFENGPGVVVIAGTGSIAFGRNAAGKTGRAGGWGFAVSDEGSGAWIGRHTVAAALRARDEGGNTPFLEAVQKSWKLTSFDGLILAANATPPAEFASLFPAVVAAAGSGDEVAQEVLTQAGAELAKLAAIVVGRLFAESAASVAMIGGVFRNGARVRESFSASLASQLHDVIVNPAVVDPVDGALAMARAIYDRRR